MPSRRPHAASTSAQVSSTCPAVREVTTTSAPSSASRTHTARPMPVPAPVTSATLPGDPTAHGFLGARTALGTASQSE